MAYCNVVWGAASPSLLQRLVVLQKRAIRIIDGSGYLETTGPIFKKLFLLKMPEIILFQTLQYIFKSLHNLLPKSCAATTVNINSIKPYNTRHTNYFNIPFSRTSHREQSLQIRGLRDWNTLPSSLQNLDSFPQFRRELRTYLSDQ